MAYIGVVAMIPLVVALFYVANSAMAVHDRTRAQDTADMIALMHASEGARAMNTLSMNQVTMTQVFATGVTSGSMIPIMSAQIGMGAFTMAASAVYMTRMCNNRYSPLKAIPIVGGALFAAAFAACMTPLIPVEIEFATNIGETAAIFFNYDPVEAHSTSFNAIQALNLANQELYDRFPESVSVQAQQIAEEMNVHDYYYDDACANPGGAGPVRSASCENNNNYQGMNLPVVKNLRMDGYLRFCLAMHAGTSGLNLPNIPQVPILSDLIGIPGSSGITLMNGSYVERGFAFNEGPLAHGGDDENPHLRDFINIETGLGGLIEEYWTHADADSLFDGLINPLANIQRQAEGILDLAELASDEVDEINDQLAAIDIPAIGAVSPDSSSVFGLNWPYEQEEENNVYLDLVNLRVLNQCAGDPAGALLGAINLDLGGLEDEGLGFIASLTGALPNIDVYHPAYDNMGFTPSLPVIQPDFDDFSDHYKIVSVVERIANDRWAPDVFENPNESFFAMSQAIIFNSEEVGLYSQNWEALLMPLSKVEDTGTDFVQRMQQNGQNEFPTLAERMSPAVNAEGWDRVTVR